MVKMDNKENIEAENNDTNEQEKINIAKEIFSWVRLVIAAFLIAFLLTHFVIVNAEVPTGSMENTIPTGSRLIGSRLTYNFSDPERFDIIIFKAPDSPEENYVKRLIGLPGETVMIDDAKITIKTVDGEYIELEEDYLKEEWKDGTGPYTYEVPEDCYFMLGDNRNNSNDARKWINTFVTRDALVGKVEVLYFPFTAFKWLGNENYKTIDVTD